MEPSKRNDVHRSPPHRAAEKRSQLSSSFQKVLPSYYLVPHLAVCASIRRYDLPRAQHRWGPRKPRSFRAFFQGSAGSKCRSAHLIEQCRIFPSDPSHQITRSGVHSAWISLTHWASFRLIIIFPFSKICTRLAMVECPRWGHVPSQWESSTLARST